MAKTFILSLGGSLVVTPEGIDAAFLKGFRDFIKRQLARGHRFYLVVGGGVTARTYIKAALGLARVSATERDWVGISATRLNAQLVRVIFGSLAYSELVTDPTRKIRCRQGVIVAGGYKPGWSTDYVSVLLAKHSGAKTLINLSNIDYAYDKDPRKFPGARKITKASWPEFQKLVGHVWKPGLNVPFDPVASREAAKSRIEVVILNGKNLKNLGDYLAGKDFKGTTIS